MAKPTLPRHGRPRVLPKKHSRVRRGLRRNSPANPPRIQPSFRPTRGRQPAPLSQDQSKRLRVSSRPPPSLPGTGSTLTQSHVGAQHRCALLSKITIAEGLPSAYHTREARKRGPPRHFERREQSLSRSL